MSLVDVEISESLATLMLARGKVNALNTEILARLQEACDELASNDEVHALVITGRGKFFSFGFDVPWLRPLPREDCEQFVTRFTELYTQLYTFPKPVVAALNGHTIAGGCMLALACDERVMASERCKISLNEITFGSTVFAGSVEMLRALVGLRNAEVILYTGEMYTAEQAHSLGLVDVVAPPDAVMTTALARARELGEKDDTAFASLKALIRGPVAEEMRRRESSSIRAFLDIWYSERTRRRLEGIQIHQ